MSVRQYIGARYTTKIYKNSLDPSSAEWEASVTYEPLTMVTYNNSTYLSKKQVPGSVGNPADNPDYWVVTGYYNGQIMQLQNDIQAIHAGYVTPEMFGAVGDGATDDTAALQAAIDSGAIVKFRAGATYIISNTLMAASGMTLFGNYATIKVKDNNRIESAMMLIDQVGNISITGLIFDMNMQNMPLYTEDRVKRYNIGVYINDSANVTLSGCAFIDLYNQGVFIYNSHYDVQINNCAFTSPLQNQGDCAEFIAMQTVGDGVIKIVNNMFSGTNAANANYGVCAITASGTSCVLSITDNIIYDCGRNNYDNHRLAPIDLYGDCSNVYVNNNVITSLHMFMRIEDCDNIHVTANKFTDISQDREGADEPFIWVDFGGVYPLRDTVENIYILNNELICNGNKEGNVIAIWNAKASSDKVLNNVVIENNKIIGSDYYSPIKTDGRCNDLIIKNNSIIAGSTIAIQYYTGSITTEAVTVKHQVISDNYVIINTTKQSCKNSTGYSLKC